MMGLTNGTAYNFTVTASNAVGAGAASAPSGSITPATFPDPPTNVIATPGNGQASVTWLAPANTGGSPITGYTVTSTPGSFMATTTGATTATVLGLTNGTPYTFTATAANAMGTGSPSTASSAVTPTPLPGAPTNVSATPGDQKATVYWTAPNANGSPISSYSITPYVNGVAQSALVTTATASPGTVLGLTNGPKYT